MSEEKLSELDSVSLTKTFDEKKNEKIGKNTRGWIKFIKEELSLILLLPTVLGGFWQLTELLSISTGYVRFFSISQLVPDGLLVLVILSSIYLAYKLGIGPIARRFNQDIEDNYAPPLWQAILGLPITACIFTFFALPIIKDVLAQQSYNLLTLLVLLSFNIILIGLILFSIFRLLRYLAFKYNGRLWKYLDDANKSERLKQIFINLFPYAAFIFTVLFLKLLFIDMAGFWSTSREGILLPSELANYKNLSNTIECRYGKSAKFKLKYFNDKYLFFEIDADSVSNKILVLEFTHLFNTDDCVK